MPVLILLRGAPGSGKSTAASKLWGFAHYETDQYFMHDGYYSPKDFGIPTCKGK